DTVTTNDALVWANSGRVVAEKTVATSWTTQRDLRSTWTVPGITLQGRDANGQFVDLSRIWGGNNFAAPFVGPTGWQRSVATTFFASSDGSIRSYNNFGRPQGIAPWTVTKSQSFNGLGVPNVDLNYTAQVSYTTGIDSLWDDLGVQRNG